VALEHRALLWLLLGQQHLLKCGSRGGTELEVRYAGGTN